MRLTVLLQQERGLLKATIPALPHFSMLGHSLTSVMSDVEKQVGTFINLCSRSMDTPVTIKPVDSMLLLAMNVNSPVAVAMVEVTSLIEGTDYVLAKSP